jgi:hypothetical protein
MTAIATHFDALMPKEEQERIGANSDQPEHMRVMRALDHYEQMRAVLVDADDALTDMGWHTDRGLLERIRAVLGRS